MENRLAERRPLQLITINTKTGEVKTLLRGTDWYNHIQFSPTDPTLLMFCHEGPWHKVDRTWTIRTDGTALTQIHHRTMMMEIEGHEWFGADGKWIWYDLQTPKSQDFWVAGYEVATGRSHLVSPRSGVNGRCTSTCRLTENFSPAMAVVPTVWPLPGNGQWIYLFRPELVPDRTDGELPNAKDLIQAGCLQSREAGQSGEAQLQARTQRHVYSRHEMDCIPLEHVWADACLRSRDRESKRQLKANVNRVTDAGANLNMIVEPLAFNGAFCRFQRARICERVPRVNVGRRERATLA